MSKYKLVHFPQVPCTPFEVESHDLQYLVELSDVIGNYDLFLLEHNHRGDYANVSIIEEFFEDEGEWLCVDEWEIEEILAGKEA